MTANDIHPETGGHHLSVEEIASYVDGRAPGSERTRMERHLADCEICGGEVVAAATTVRHRRRVDPRFLVPFASAAVVGGLLFLGSDAFDRTGDSGMVLRSGADSAPRVRVLRPADRATVSTAHPVFVWRPVSASASYSFTIKNEVGDVLWHGDTSDTTHTLEGHLTLRPGERYFWEVEALLPDGRPAASRPHELRVVP